VWFILHMSALPSCDELFLKFFDPWYDEGGRRRRRFKATFPDIEQVASFVGRSEADVSPLKEERRRYVRQHISRMIASAREDMQTYLSVQGEIDISWIDAFDRHYDRPRIQELIEKSDPKDFGNPYLITCCEFGAISSHVLKKAEPDLIWYLTFPYWDSCLVDSRTGTKISIFHWGVKKLSEYGVDDGYAGKTKACLAYLRGEIKSR
jgi:hypothetical protein